MAPRAMVSSVQKSSQEGRPRGLLPYPALFLRGSSVHGNVLKDRAKSWPWPAPCQQGATPSSRSLLPGGLLDIVPRVTIGTQELRPVRRARSRVLVTSGASRKQLPRERRLAVSHMRPSEKYCVCTHQPETAALCQASVGLGPLAAPATLVPTPTPYTGLFRKGGRDGACVPRGPPGQIVRVWELSSVCL